MIIEIEEEARQAIILALAELALERPGWDYFLRGVAERFGSSNALDMFEMMKKIHRHRIICIQDEKEPSTQRSAPFLLDPLCKAAEEVLLNAGVEALAESLNKLRTVVEQVQTAYGYKRIDHTPGQEGPGSTPEGTEHPVSEAHG